MATGERASGSLPLRCAVVTAVVLLEVSPGIASDVASEENSRKWQIVQAKATNVGWMSTSITGLEGTLAMKSDRLLRARLWLPEPSECLVMRQSKSGWELLGRVWLLLHRSCPLTLGPCAVWPS